MVETMTPVLLDRYIAVILRYRWPVATLATLLMLVMTAGARFIAVTNDYRILFGEKQSPNWPLSKPWRTPTPYPIRH